MNKTDQPAFVVDVIEHRWIPMPDGVRLSARIWLPQCDGPTPAILEYIPYRKRDLVRRRDERNHPVFAANGYACLRVDMRGSGDSEGAMPDMYAPDELSDARHVIEWIAAQPWCDGRVGMFGTSWGGTASLQAAVDAPGPLKAVIANAATADRFEDDIHWMGGCLLTDSVEWGATLPAILAAPPDPATVGPDWRAQWLQRLDAMANPLDAWVAENRRGAYWRRGSVRFQADRLACPVLAIGGWSDRYSNSVMRLTDARPDLCRGVVGPWGHHYADQGEPGPALDFQSLALNWWDRWLKEEGNGSPPWLPLRLWRRGFDPPADRLDRRSGGWIALDRAAPDREQNFFPTADGGLASSRPERADGDPPVPFDLAHGGAAGDTGYFGRVGGLPLDQAPDDARALTFETAPLDEDLLLDGAAALTLSVLRRARAAQLAARLCDVAPDGRSNLIARTVLNLVLDEDLDEDRPFEADAPQEVALRFPTTSYRLRPGHRLRLALAGSYWPLAFPTLHDPEMRVRVDGAVLTLPFATGAPSTRAFADERFQPTEVDGLRDGVAGRAQNAPDVERNALEKRDGWWRMGWRLTPAATVLEEIGATVRVETAASYRVTSEGPAEASCRIDHNFVIERPDGAAEMRSKAELSSGASGFRRRQTLEVRFDGETLRRFDWD